jgi:hypothetical protein
MADTNKYYRCIRKKITTTFLDRFVNSSHNIIIRDKIKNTCIKRCSVDYRLKSSIVRNKIINRLLPVLPVLPLLLTILFAHKNCTTTPCI